MDLQSLLQLDITNLKNVDWKKTWEDLSKRKDVLIAAALVLVAIIVSLNLFLSKSRQRAYLRSQISLFQQKSKAVDQLTQARKDLEEAKKGLPQEIVDDEIISKIAAMANKLNISITNFSPLTSEDRGNHSLTLVTLNVTANDFQSLWRFIHEVENSSYALRIENWATNLSGYLNQFLRNPEAPKPPMTARIVIGALHIK